MKPANTSQILRRWIKKVAVDDGLLSILQSLSHEQNFESLLLHYSYFNGKMFKRGSFLNSPNPTLPAKSHRIAYIVANPLISFVFL